MKDVFARLSRRGAALAVVALAAMGVGAAVAAIPNANGTINGCYNNTNGALRVIDTAKGQTCVKPSETPIQWSQTGPQGPIGPQGAKGEPGTFAGHFASPNGQFSLDITDAGIVLTGPTNSVTINGDLITVTGAEDHFGGTVRHFDTERHFGFEEHQGDELHRFNTEDHQGDELHRSTERHFGTEQHSGTETHFGTEDHQGDETHRFNTERHFGREEHNFTEIHNGFEEHHGNENHFGAATDGQIVFGAKTFFTANCSDDPPQFFKVDVGLNGLGSPFFAPGVSACK